MQSMMEMLLYAISVWNVFKSMEECSRWFLVSNSDASHDELTKWSSSRYLYLAIFFRSFIRTVTSLFVRVQEEKGAIAQLV